MSTYTIRSCSREYNEAPILILTKKSYSSYMKNRHYYAYAQMRNFHQKGMYFESDYAIQPGSNISIKMDDVSSNYDCDSSSRKVHHATVKWCKQIKHGEDKRYGVGAKISETVVQSEVH